MPRTPTQDQVELATDPANQRRPRFVPTGKQRGLVCAQQSSFPGLEVSLPGPDNGTIVEWAAVLDRPHRIGANKCFDNLRTAIAYTSAYESNGGSHGF
jgi:hypothetical protein